MKMDWQKFEQRCNIKFCVKLGESTTVTYIELQRAYGEHYLSRAQVFRWQKSFLEGREQVEDEPHAGRPSTSKTDDIVERVRSDHRLTLRMTSELNLNRFTVHQILVQALDMRKVCTKMVPKNLSTEQKAIRRDVCLDLLDCLEREPEFFNHVITGDESWILEYDLETKRQIREWHTANSPHPKKARMSKSKIKSMLICFFDSRGSSTRNLCQQDKLLIKLFIGKSLKDSRKGWHVCDQALHAHGCCTTTTPHVTQQSPSMNFRQKKMHFCCSSFPYSLDLSPCDFFLFPWLKNHLQGRHFGTLDNIQKSVTDELKGIPAEAFQHRYEQWKRLHRCVAAQGNYFKGDNLDL